MERLDYFGDYIPSARQASDYYRLTGILVVRGATAIEEEFGTHDRRVVTGLDLEFGGAGDKIRRGPNIPKSFISENR